MLCIAFGSTMMYIIPILYYLEKAKTAKIVLIGVQKRCVIVHIFLFDSSGRKINVTDDKKK